MEVTGIETTQIVKKVGQKVAIQAASIVDTVAISSEADKRAEWVDMIKQMPDIRPEKIDSALSNPTPSHAELAQKIINSIF